MHRLKCSVGQFVLGQLRDKIVDKRRITMMGDKRHFQLSGKRLKYFSGLMVATVHRMPKVSG
ncbi:hypothetical protein A8E14_23610 [Burkholderia cenocepacia]|nr:hypothetical protein A8E14_23610 [Burkholderia cenocepacia]